MKHEMNLAFALAAGLLGGLLARYVAPISAHAQAQPPQEIRAQAFTIVDAQDHVMGTFKFVPEPRGSSKGLQTARIVLLDSTGREIWSAGGDPMRQITER